MRMVKITTTTGLAMSAAFIIGCASNDYNTASDRSSERRTDSEIAMQDRYSSSQYEYSSPRTSTSNEYLTPRSSSTSSTQSGTSMYSARDRGLEGEDLAMDSGALRYDDTRRTNTTSSNRMTSDVASDSTTRSENRLTYDTGTQLQDSYDDALDDNADTSDSWNTARNTANDQFASADYSQRSSSSAPSRDFQSGVSANRQQIDQTQSTPSRDFSSGVMNDGGYTNKPISAAAGVGSTDATARANADIGVAEADASMTANAQDTNINATQQTRIGDTQSRTQAKLGTQQGVDNTQARLGISGGVGTDQSQARLSGQSDQQFAESQQGDVRFRTSEDQTSARQVAGTQNGKWGAWSQNVSNETAQAKDRLDQQVARLDQQMQQVLEEKNQLESSYDERLMSLEQQRQELENQLDMLYAQGDRALPQLNREFQTARVGSTQLDASATTQRQSQQSTIDEDRTISDIEYQDMQRSRSQQQTNSVVVPNDGEMESFTNDDLDAEELDAEEGTVEPGADINSEQ